LQGLGSYPGTPDLEGAIRGRHFYIEVKTKTGKLSDRQKLFQENFEVKQGEKFFVARDFYQFRKEFEEWMKEKS
jgi:hypothetical protein